MIPSARIYRGVRLTLFLWLAGFLLGGSLRAEENFFCDVWTLERGLPDSSVTSIAQTPDGYLWVGTYNGLARFDGLHFTTFDPGNTPELMHARVRKLFVDRQGTLWINTYDGSLTAVRHGKFILERRNTRSSEGEVNLVLSTSNRVVFVTGRGDLLEKSMAEPPDKGWNEISPPGRGVGALGCADGENTLWYRDAEMRLWRLRGKTFTRVPASTGADGKTINCMVTGPQGRLWLGEDDGLAVWDGEKFRREMPVDPAFTNVAITAVTVAKDGRVWVVANGCAGEIFNHHWVVPPTAARNLFGASPDRIDMQADDQGGMWFYNYGRGLAHVNAAGHVHRLTTADGFPGERVYCFFKDREGDWWAGLDAGGLVRVRETQFHTVAVGRGILAKAAKSVCEDPNGAVWIGMLGGGLLRWQDDAEKQVAVPGDTDLGSVFCVCPDADGRFWLSAENEDLFVWQGGSFQRVTPTIHGVKSLLADPRHHRIWVGTTSGLYFADQTAPENFQLFNGISHRSVRALAQDRQGNIWAGTGTGEIYKIAGGNAVMYRPDDSRESGAIWSLLADDAGVVWVGTFRGGLLRLQDGKFTRFTTSEGLPDNVICQILDDGKGNLWLGSHQGVFRVSKAALNQVAAGKEKFVTCVVYGRSDGLPALECCGGYQPAACRTRDGRFWFTTIKGAAWIKPDELQPNVTPPPVTIEEVLVDGRRQTGYAHFPGYVTRSEKQKKSSSPLVGVLEIPPGRHQIEIRYNGLSLVSPDHVQFRYKMQSVDDTWVQAENRRFVQYNFLPPGHYRFQVIACNSDGVWNQTGAALALIVDPHFYETWWFRALALIAFVGVVAGTVRHTATRRLRAQMEQLERRQVVERERARIAKDIHDDLGASLTLIAVLGDLARKTNAPARIEKMSTTARQAVKSLDEIVWAVNPRNDTLSHLIDYAGQFATGYLREVGIRCFLDVPDQTPVREVAANLRHNVFLVIKEALQNIVKHARASEVWLRISATPERLRVVIEDNGRGFDRPPEDAWADGLGNMRQRLAEIGGHCDITSRPGQGTTITLELPWPAPA
jgi:signal transduction histidine kinase/ligand-binding sensor domain-containing protein